MRAIEVTAAKPPKRRKPRAKSYHAKFVARAPRQAKIKLPLTNLPRRPAMQAEVAGEGSMF